MILDIPSCNQHNLIIVNSIPFYFQSICSIGLDILEAVYIVNLAFSIFKVSMHLQPHWIQRKFYINDKGSKLNVHWLWPSLAVAVVHWDSHGIGNLQHIVPLQHNLWTSRPHTRLIWNRCLVRTLALQYLVQTLQHLVQILQYLLIMTKIAILITNIAVFSPNIKVMSTNI